MLGIRRLHPAQRRRASHIQPDPGEEKEIFTSWGDRERRADRLSSPGIQMEMYAPPSAPRAEWDEYLGRFQVGPGCDDERYVNVWNQVQCRRPCSGRFASAYETGLGEAGT
jgi:hypothetical protein